MQEPEELTFKDLREITDGFSEKVGEGGFGTVYKGVAKTGKHVAVKILRDGISKLDHDQFRNEFHNLMKVQHGNIVQFLGYCCEIEQTSIKYDGRTVLAEKVHRALCFEFMHNGSLQKHLSDESCGHDWNTRYRIIKGICEGLRYIHEDLEESLLHLDLKPDNILLDEDMVPKIADFGLSRIFGDQLTNATQSSFGTLGYKPPEYIDKKEISKKFDIFSLGVIITKIVSGPESYPKCLDMPLYEFVDQVGKNWRKRWQATCSNDFSFETCCRQVETCTQIALDCLEKDSQKRPDIVKMIEELNKIELDISKENYLDILQPTQTRRETVCGMVEWDNTQETSFDAGKELIVGREEIKKRMASSIESMSEKIVILPIYGIGGIGKTTFARLIYNDTKLKYYSQVWVYVSPRFDLCKIGNSIISQLTGKENHTNELELIKCCLTKLLSGKKILIVLDDLWENNTIQLVDLKDMLHPGDSIKTIVLVTTRSEEIAKKICINVEPHKIEALTDEMCWDIMKQKSVFEARHDKEKLVGIGKNIARKCGGVALAAQTLGSMLQSMEYDQWISMRDSYIWNQTISNNLSLPNHVLASLKLSFESMNDSLKKCFKYCAIFPKGHKIVRRDLIYQWLSLDFIKPTLLSSPLQLCEKHIIRLLGLGFLQYSMPLATYRALGEHDTAFTMHDLVHDLATSLLGDEIFDQSTPGSTRGSSSRYALLLDCSKPLDSCMASPGRLSALRFLDCQGTELHGCALESAESLRVLDLSECSIQELPDSVGQLKQLRYLDAPRIRDRMVPECITALSNLTYLSLRGSCAIVTLPELIGGIEGLVHLDLSGCLGIRMLPESFGNLTCLEHLDFSYCKYLTGLSQCLARLTKLQHLNLSNCEYICGIPITLGSLTELLYLNLSDILLYHDDRHSEANFLVSLTKLRYLNLSSRNNGWSYLMLPEALGCLTELEHLDLSGNWEIRELPASFGNLCNLVRLELSHCYRLRNVPAALNGLNKLQYLDLSSSNSISVNNELLEVFGNLSQLRHLNLDKCINIQSSHPRYINDLLGRICTLTNLEYLNLGHNYMKCIPETLANLRKLHTLDLSYCHSLRRLPASIFEIDSLKFLYTEGCSTLVRSMLPQNTSSSRIAPSFVAQSHIGDAESNKYPFLLESENPAFLKISRLENVKSPKDVLKIKLVEKTGIIELGLKWTRSAKRFVDDAEVLRELVPPYSVSQFYLEGYDSVSFPSWVMRINDYLPGLRKIEMSDFPSCINLPPLGQLPNLMYLALRRMDGIKKIGTDLYGGVVAFPHLSELVIDEMKCLEEWNNEPMSPRLSSIEIRHCPKLSINPCPPQSASLRIENSDQVMLSPLGNTGQVGASAVKHLFGDRCAVPLHRWSLLVQLPCLKNLMLIDCSDLTCTLPEFLGGLTSLRSLTVERCQSIVSLPERLGDLTSLTELEIINCKGIKTLPDSVQKLVHLQTLNVSDCESVESLPERLGDITSLREIKIFNRRGIKTLPDTIQKLTHLQVLRIYGCPELVQWCESKENKVKLAHSRVLR